MRQAHFVFKRLLLGPSLNKKEQNGWIKSGHPKVHSALCVRIVASLTQLQSLVSVFLANSKLNFIKGIEWIKEALKVNVKDKHRININRSLSCSFCIVLSS